MQLASIGSTQGQHAASSTDLLLSKIVLYMSAFRYNKESTHYGDFIDQTIRLSMTALMLISCLCLKECPPIHTYISLNMRI
jgi:hypothetical protein